MGEEARVVKMIADKVSPKIDRGSSSHVQRNPGLANPHGKYEVLMRIMITGHKAWSKYEQARLKSWLPL